jgi:hypothetical protein
MATIGEMVDIMGRALGLSREGVAGHMRMLRENGMLTMKGHGRGAAKMTYADAARLLIAVAGSLATKDSVETVQSFGELEPSTDGWPKEARRNSYCNAEVGLAGELEYIAFQNNKGTLHPAYRRLLDPLYSDRAAVTFHSVVGISSKAFPKIVVVRRILAVGNYRRIESSAGLVSFNFAPKGWSAAKDSTDLSHVIGSAPGLLQTRHVSFPAFSEIALAL